MPLLHNPITMQGHIDQCWLLTYRMPIEQFSPILPAELTATEYQGYGFWNIVICHVAHMRPWFAPQAVGINYWHVAYRIYVNLKTSFGIQQGLYFVRSDCDNRLLAWAGNLVTNFNFHHTPIVVNRSVEQTRISIKSTTANADIVIDNQQPAQLASDSVFESLEQAAKQLKYPARGIALSKPGEANIVSIERDEASWQHSLRHVQQAEFQLLKQYPVQPEICYEIQPIDYRWLRGYRRKVLMAEQ